MGPGTPSYYFPQQQQQQQSQVPLHLNPAFAPIPVHQFATGSAYRPSLYGQAISNGLQQQYMGLPIGSGSLSGAQQRTMLPPQEVALLQQPWNHVSHESRAWGSSSLPNSAQGLIQPPLIQHISQQQQAYLQDARPASIGRNGGYLPQFQGADMAPALARQPYIYSNDTRGQFGMAATTMGRNSHMQTDGMQGPEAFRGNMYGNGQTFTNEQSHVKPYENGNGSPGNWYRGGGNHGSSNSRFRGGKAEKSRGGDPVRSKPVVLRCDPCAKTFTNAQQSNAHFSTHAKCDAEGCSFEASGRVLKEHRQLIHGILSELPVRSKDFKSTESEEEVFKWREERRVNYPTTSNIVRKAEEAKAKRLRGELVDEDARKRRERLKEILARQAELGVPVAEVPSYYMSDLNPHWKSKGGRTDHTAAPQIGMDRKRPKDDKNRLSGEIEAIAATESSCTATPNSRKSARRFNIGEYPGDGMTNPDVEEPEHKIARTVDVSIDCRNRQSVVEMEVDAERGTQTTSVVKEHNETKMIETGTLADQGRTTASKSAESRKVCGYFLRGRCRKGNRCEYLHERRLKKKKEVPQQPVPKRTPTLLEKLLESDIRREKSHLLQAFRFFVNNMFLLEYPEKPLDFFYWQKEIDGQVEQRRATALDTDTNLQANGSHEAADVGSGTPMDECGILRDALAADSEILLEGEEGYTNDGGELF